jgi:hypothetical protein
MFAKPKAVADVQATETPGQVLPHEIMVKQGRTLPVEYWPAFLVVYRFHSRGDGSRPQRPAPDPSRLSPGGSGRLDHPLTRTVDAAN